MPHLSQTVEIGIAERIRAQGAPAAGTYRQFAQLSVVPEDTDVPDAPEMVRRLVAAHEGTWARSADPPRTMATSH